MAAKGKYDVIVIGTGPGGSACAGLLAQGGARTLVLEKNPRIGGACSYYEKDGFHLCIGTHLISRCAKGPLGAALKRLNIPGAVKFPPKRFLTRFKGLGMDVRVPTQARDQLPFFFRFFKQLGIPATELPAVVKLFYRLQFLSEQKVVNWNDRTVEEFILAHTRHPKLFHFLTVAIGSYFVLPFYDASAGEAIWCSRHMTRDRAAGYPAGGTVAIPRAYLQAAESYGAEVRTNARVKRIHVANDAVMGVETGDGQSFEARAVVSTSAAGDTLRLAGSGNFPPEYANRVKSLKISMTAMQAKIALDRPVFAEGGLLASGFTDPDKDISALTIENAFQMFRDYEAGKIPQMMGFFCSIPTNYDPSLAPPGRQLLSIITGAPFPDTPSEASQKEWDEAMLKAFFNYFPEAKDHVMWIDTLPPRFLVRWLGKTNAPIISNAQTPDQVADKRLPHRTPVRGLYLAGDNSAGRGIGTELACQSGMDCADLLLHDLEHLIV